MSRAVAWTGGILVAIALAAFGWKTLVLGMPLAPSDPVGLWSVELEASARGDGESGTLAIALPSTGPGQLVFDEHSSSDRLVFTIRTEKGQRLGLWSGRFTGVHRVSHGFRVQLAGLHLPVASRVVNAPLPDEVAIYTEPTHELPSDADEVAALLDTLPLPGPTEPGARLRALFTYVAEEIQTVPSGSDDAVLALLAREGSAMGTTRLFATLLRGAGIPARLAYGLRLRDQASPQPHYGVLVWIGDRWVPFSPSEGQFAERPSDVVLVRIGSLEPVDETGIGAVAFAYHGLRERLRPEEVAAMMLPQSDLLTALSLYRLPIATQSLLRALLLLPVAALVMAVLRNLVGIPTYGTFLPILLAFALRGTSLGIGLTMVTSVLVLAILGRVGLERLRLLLVPRLAFLLCLIVLTVVGMSLLGRGFENRDLYRGVLFPMVILTMMAERVTITMQEEGARAALIRVGSTASVVLALSPIFQNELAEHLVFGFPEIIIGIMGLLVWIGGYTGYRLSDLVRFRSFAGPDPELAP